MSSVIEVPTRTIRTVFAPLAGVEVRDPSGNHDGAWSMTGYAAVFEQETTLFDAYGLRVKEELARDAFGSVLERLSRGEGLVHLNHGHNMESAVASTDVARKRSTDALPVGGLELDADGHGLRFFARVDERDPDAIRLAAKMRRGVVSQASFAFTIEDERVVDERDGDDGFVEVKYRIESVRELFDVCVCAQGAYPQTESHLRSITAASLRVPAFELDRAALVAAGSPGRELDELGSEHGRSSDAGDAGDVDEGRVASARKRLELKALAASATLTT